MTLSTLSLYTRPLFVIETVDSMGSTVDKVGADKALFGFPCILIFGFMFLNADLDIFYVYFIIIYLYHKE